MKKISIFVTLFIITFGITCVFAEDSAICYSLEEIQQQAVINNKQIGIDDLNIKSMQSALNKAQEDAKWLGDAFEPAAALKNKIIREVDPMEAESNLEAACKEKELNISSLELDAYKQGINLLLLNKQLDAENKKLDILKEKLKIAQAKLKSGKITENDLTQIEYDLDSKQNSIESIREEMKTASLKLESLLNIDLDDRTIVIKGDITYQLLNAIDLDGFIEDAANNSVEIFKAGERVKAEEKRVELTALYYKQGDSTYDSNVLSLETAKLDLESAKTNLNVTIRNKYNDLLNQKGKVETADKYLTLCDKKLANLKVKLKKGLISSEAVISGEEDDIEAAYQKVLAVYDYNVQKAEFLSLSGKQDMIV